MLNIGDVSRLNGRRYPDKVALIGADNSLTYAELDAASNRLGHGLIAMGVAKGDRVGLLSLNRVEYAVVTQAAAKIGAILVPINFRLKPTEFAHILRDSGVKVLILETAFQAQLAEALPDRDDWPALLLFEDAPDGAHDYAGILAAASADQPPVMVDEHDPCVIMYTSGTTGTPKGVVVEHRTYLRMYNAQALEAQLVHEDVFLLAVPMFHAAGMNLALQQCLFMGSTGVIHRGSFAPPAILRLIEQHRITVAVLVPTTIAMLATDPASTTFDGSSMTRVFYGAMPVTPPIQEMARRIFPHAGLVQIYGSTETGMATILRAADHQDHWAYTGREALLSEIRVVDVEGAAVPVGKVGEVIVRQAMLGMREYWNNPQATAETVRNGWIHSGDLARVEPGGFITVVDRMKDMVISGGENVYPKEVETVLLAHPAVTDAAVFGVPDLIYGEAVAAAISVSEPVERAALIAFCKEALAGYKVPRVILTLDTLPRNSSDKIQKTLLRDIYRGLSEAQQQELRA